ncbi:unnamed protein product [Prorocentrum cordatum]|uniref:Uncharacterized protein n=1 Tax=Prorocentrum cordatum TaxID=2364126 RepID=A0ABN9UP45_9DINO|nr:unnamed protein product [Polarella glacialis]
MELRLVTGKCIKRKRVSTQGREREGGGMGARKSAVRRLDCMPSRPRGCGWSAFAAPNAPMHTTRRKRERERESEAYQNDDGGGGPQVAATPRGSLCRHRAW